MGRWLVALVGLVVVTAIGVLLIAPMYFSRHPWILPLLAVVGVASGWVVGHLIRRTRT